MALTRDQKITLAWVDWSAGVCAAGLGLFSFLVGGAASVAFKSQQGWLMAAPAATDCRIINTHLIYL